MGHKSRNKEAARSRSSKSNFDFIVMARDRASLETLENRVFFETPSVSFLLKKQREQTNIKEVISAQKLATQGTHQGSRA